MTEISMAFGGGDCTPSTSSGKCDGCGKCCKEIYLITDVPHRPKDRDQMEITALAMWHGTEIVQYEKDGARYLAYKLTSPCSNLKEKDGKYYCDAYEFRPIICRNYFCKGV